MIYSLVNGFLLGSIVFALGLVVDNTISKETKKYIEKDNYKLYDDGQKKIQFNLLIASPFIYSFIYETCINKTKFFIFEIEKVFIILLIQNLGYFLVHKIFHINTKFYKYHKFHHKFDKILIPSIGNAVSLTEFILAYMTPFGIGAYFTFPSEFSFIVCLFIIAVLNMSIHCFELKNTKYPKFLVSPEKHFNHHRVRNKHYAAPFVDIDEIFERN
jgi:sterol desaturase/sphingolipid hydroxylase (fatty acid hydroxylase superfamily)